MSANENHRKIRISIDGEDFTIHEDDQQAQSLLRLASLNPDDYDLARIRPGQDPVVYKDEQILELRDGECFISVKRKSTVA